MRSSAAARVGATSACAILMNGTIEELVIVDEDGEKMRGEVMDLQHAVLLASSVRIWVGDYKVSCGAVAEPGLMRRLLRNIIG